ncbi:zinc dependent phospholipase C family protein [Bacillus sp. FJAT-27245]|uniref:zinc dependent phospholipase C family protein n=1 Tax=Bacillus sp. FJAT-27245 TaxID=1684144 RepID=UPI0006A7B2BB|nr:zinc dependent phospholipase C family protein [Bacillus sp. FJAT-27245]
MGSRIMHSIIGNKIAEILSIQDRTSFLLGSIAPDAVFSVEEKNASHFFVGDVKDFSRRVNYGGFLQKYRLHIEDNNDYILGYYTHLIADDIWLRGFYQSWLKNRMDADEGFYEYYHNDFRMLNGKLLEHYGCKDELKRTFNHFPAILDLEEVKAQDVEKFVPYVLGDMEYGDDVLNGKLNVFTLDQIVGYIETAVQLSVLKLNGQLV